MRAGGGPDRSFPELAEGERIRFPDPATADDIGIVCAGANLSPGAA